MFSFNSAGIGGTTIGIFTQLEQLLSLFEDIGLFMVSNLAFSKSYSARDEYRNVAGERQVERGGFRTAAVPSLSDGPATHHR